MKPAEQHFSFYEPGGLILAQQSLFVCIFIKEISADIGQCSIAGGSVPIYFHFRNFFPFCESSQQFSILTIE